MYLGGNCEGGCPFFIYERRRGNATDRVGGTRTPAGGSLPDRSGPNAHVKQVTTFTMSDKRHLLSITYDNVGLIGLIRINKVPAIYAAKAILW